MNTPPISEAGLPALPAPWTAASTLKCAVCKEPYNPPSPGPMCAGGWLHPVKSHACKCGSTTFLATIGYDSPSPAAYTADQMREYATTALKAAAQRIAELERECNALRNDESLATHKALTCGVAASHPDQNLTRTGSYAKKWDSPQAEAVRQLRARAESAEARVAELQAGARRLREALEWYADEARALARHVPTGVHTSAVLASLTALSIDGGARAVAAFSADEPPAMDAALKEGGS